MNRRDFIALLGGAAVAWPRAARAQQGDRVRRVGVLSNLAENDSQLPLLVATFSDGLQEWGWTVGRNLQIDYCWTAGAPERAHGCATELVALAPDVIVTTGASHVAALQRATRAVPIVFLEVTDPVGGGLIASLAEPGGNTTGFIVFEYGLSEKWLELLKEIAPGVTRAAVIRDPAIIAGIGQWGAIGAAAPLLGVELSPVNVRDVDIERAIATFARGPNGGLIVQASPLAKVHRDLIITLASRHRLPAVYPDRSFVTGGGLISYGPNAVDQYRRAAGYVHRILKGEKPSNLPVQGPTKYELVINLKTAKALGLDLPASVLARAGEVIE
jgi:ABC-type uncharacterized transport system substrate-binding protein